MEKRVFVLYLFHIVKCCPISTTDTVLQTRRLTDKNWPVKAASGSRASHPRREGGPRWDPVQNQLPGIKIKPSGTHQETLTFLIDHMREEENMEPPRLHRTVNKHIRYLHIHAFARAHTHRHI